MVAMKLKIYNFLVNRYPGIRERYHQYRDKTTGAGRYFSWLYLLWLNFCFYVLRIRSLGTVIAASPYEEKKFDVKQSESRQPQQEGITVSSFVERLSGFDVISFDIFDTLIFRPFSEPTDLFFFLGEQFGRMDFKRLRKEAEADARRVCYKANGHYEVTLAEIWAELEHQTGCSGEQGIQAEIALEKRFCYANPFMLEVYRELQKQGKKLIIVSDMYLPGDVLKDLLKANGYDGFKKLYVSCEYKKSKSVGDLFELVRSEFPGTAVHVGDNVHSDVAIAKKHGFAVCHYPNVNDSGEKYRPYDMSAVIGGAYRGLVNNHLYSGFTDYSMEYEYGFVYGGLFVTGYCAFIREYCKRNGVDKILFLSRDGEILKRAYDVLFPGEETAYVYWSRRAATKLMAGEDKYDFMRRFLEHKVNQDFSLAEVFASMELEALLEVLPEGLSAEDRLTDRNVKLVRKFLEANWNSVLEVYVPEHRAAKAYYAEVLKDCKKAVAVDIGWAGSGAIALNRLVQQVWKLPCEVVGIVAGTNTLHNSEPDASEMFLQTGRLVAYMYSQSHNRDLLKKHDPNRDYNVFWELLLSSPTPQFVGFSEDVAKGWTLRFGKVDANPEGIREIQAGILDFVKAYKRHYGDLTYMYRISGRDAYAPMLVAASKSEKYLKEIEKRFGLEIHVG